ncbi:hypothetical protein LC653_32835 [Nostoc sp. CHAB 5784]|uniref:hypothetical protein n=1 Tax=Nostoc mirabile TaxID=2907820 RepID=UPI001E4F33C0|nr:hypothetical protein [Nostoc mirabile]MCC5668507.1 hypothetical protein [Nostoc mirabile CHAB5784]
MSCWSLNGWSALLGIAIVSVSTFSWNCTNAEITSDETLPTNSSIQKESNTFNITGEIKSGGNLFYSIEEFSVPTSNGLFASTEGTGTSRDLTINTRNLRH